MAISDKETFSGIRGFFWPIHRHEIKKLIPMMIMLFLICFNYSVLRNVKEAIVVTAKASGAEVIPFIKVWVLLPMAILSTIFFTRLSNRYSQERVFYIIISCFLFCFGLFTFVLYPLRDSIHPHQLADQLQAVLPIGFKGLIAMFRNWSFTIFYAICEIWASLVLQVLFWGFVNEITNLTEARRFYGILSIISSTATIVAGFSANFLSFKDSWEHTLQLLVGIIILSGCITMVIFYWMNKKVLNDTRFKQLHESHTTAKEKTSKKRLSLTESVRFLSNSKYLICIAVLVLSYNLVINLIEVVWKDQLRQLYSSPLEYNTYMNTTTSAIGIIATLTSFCMAPLISRFGWTRTALITPVLMLITSFGFFSFMLFRHDLAETVHYLMGTTPLAIAVFFGAAQVCMSKACKYSVFDSTKEMSFIPLEHETKLKGKAAIDGVGSRLGKSGGSLIHQGLMVFLGSISASAPYVAFITIGVIIAWMTAVRSLGRQFSSLAGPKEREELEETQKAAVAAN